MATDTTSGLTISRHFTTEDIHPFDTVKWEVRDAVIQGPDGKPVFEQKGVEFPASWSQRATNIVAEKYFRVLHGARETSVKQMIARISNWIALWGQEDHYFSSTGQAGIFCDELTHIFLHQYASFNSPVWFNVGVQERPQTSACYILDVEDNMESILEWYRQEGMIFKYGSGAGVNLSKIRGKDSPLSGGGIASGPLSFMHAADANAGAIKSGGKTRRAAKMVILDVEHPDIFDFIWCKAEAEKTIKLLKGAGLSNGVEGKAQAFAPWQNANNSVSVPECFMHYAVNPNPQEEVTSARDVLQQIARASWECGDPGLFFRDNVNNWNTTPSRGSIVSSNPCSEVMQQPDTACNLASLNLLKFLNDDGSYDIPSFTHAVNILITAMDILIDRSSYPTEAITQNSRDFRPLGLGYANLGALLMAKGLPYDSDEGRSYAGAITALMTGEAYAQSARLAEVKGAFAGFEVNREAMVRVIEKHMTAQDSCMVTYDEHLWETASDCWETTYCLGLNKGYRNCQVTLLAPTGTISFMMDCFTADTLVATADGRNAVSFAELTKEGKDVDVYASENGRTVIKTMRGIRKVRSNVKVVKVFFDDNSTVRCTPEHQFMLCDGSYRRADSLVNGDSLMRFDSAINDITGKPRRTIWMGPQAGGNRVRGRSWHLQYRLIGAKVFEGYDGRSGGILHHDNEDTLDDTPDNLKLCGDFSAHLRVHWGGKTPEERSSIARARQAKRTPEQRRESARKTHEAQTPEERQQRARKAVEAHTVEERSVWTKRAWETRRQKAANHKVVRVIEDGIEDVYCGRVDDVHNFAIVTSGGDDPKYADLSGIVVHNCDTTGVEPEIALVKHKQLVGGGEVTIVNQVVERALRNYWHSNDDVRRALEWLNEHGSFNGYLSGSGFLNLFQCALGDNALPWQAHVKMVAAVQPFLSGGVSKTVNMPAESTVEDIEQAFIMAWKLGLKSIAIYRDGCKATQPVTVGSRNGTKPPINLRHTDDEARLWPTIKPPYTPDTARKVDPFVIEREITDLPEIRTIRPGVVTPFTPHRTRLPDERPAHTHKFSIDGHEGYLTVGLYPDTQKPGELFIHMAKEGSTVSGLMDTIGVLTSLLLQHGVPLKVLVDKLKGTRFEPAGFTSNTTIQIAKSPVDYIFRWLEQKYVQIDAVTSGPQPENPFDVMAKAAIAAREKHEARFMNFAGDLELDAPSCPNCGMLMLRRAGACFVCDECGASSGCS